MTAPAQRPLARRWYCTPMGRYVQENTGDLIGGPTYEHNALVAAYEADRAVIETLMELLRRAHEELRLIRMKDTDAVYDVTLRIEIDIALAAAGRGK